MLEDQSTKSTFVCNPKWRLMWEMEERRINAATGVTMKQDASSIHIQTHLAREAPFGSGFWPAIAVRFAR